MTPRQSRILTVAVAGVTGLQAVMSRSSVTRWVFAAEIILAVFAFAPLLLRPGLDAMYERRAGRDLEEPEGP